MALVLIKLAVVVVRLDWGGIYERASKPLPLIFKEGGLSTKTYQAPAPHL
jgi:hypothetical protein